MTERPSFCDIVVSLQLPDFQILKWSVSDEDKYSQPAKTLGTAIEKGHGLYPELQGKYLRKTVGATKVQSESSGESNMKEEVNNDQYDSYT